MMDWTDRHCRAFHRALSRRALLYTEMIAAPALVRGRAYHLLDHDAVEHPVVVQLGGSDAAELAEAARIAADHGYVAVNLNVGCPSDRVQSGCFGAVLMREPGRVADICAAMIAAQPRPVTVKCRIGVDDQVPEQVLPAFLQTVSAAGVRSFTIHARKAWLQGLSPKENREVPPLDYPLVHAMKRDFPQLDISINGGLQDLDDVEHHLAAGMDGTMIGRAAYQRPADILMDADRRIFGAANPVDHPAVAAQAFMPHIALELAKGARLASITRHMLGLFAGRPGARIWRRMLSDGASGPGAGLDLVRAALAAVQDESLRAAG
jgi:tRNA-dihydrouridine synthase A